MGFALPLMLSCFANNEYEKRLKYRLLLLFTFTKAGALGIFNVIKCNVFTLFWLELIKSFTPDC